MQRSIQPLIFLPIYHRHNFKFCNICGYFCREDRMYARHVLKRHPSFSREQWAPLKVGELPLAGATTFRVLLRLLPGDVHTSRQQEMQTATGSD